MRHHPLDGIAREKLRITRIDVLPLSYVDPAGDLWRTGSYQVWKTDGAITRIFTDEGLVGIGEGSPYEGPAYIKEYTEQVIQPVLIGRNPFDVELLTNRGGGSRRARAPWAGVDNACWDLIGKAKGLPVYRLLATDHEPCPRVRVYASGGVEHAWYEHGERQLIEEALRYQAQGFGAFKFRCGTDWRAAGMDFARYVPILRRLRAAVGPHFRLMHEAVGTSGGVLERIITDFAPALQELGFYWFEEPFGDTRPEFLPLHLRLRAAMPGVIIAGGERFCQRFDAQEWLDCRALDIVQSDCNVAGITENWCIARMAWLRGCRSIPHNWHGGGTLIANAHFAAGIPNGEYCELNMTRNPLRDALFAEPLVVRDGYLELPDKPGFGVELSEDVERRFPYVSGSYSRPNPRLAAGRLPQVPG